MAINLFGFTLLTPRDIFRSTERTPSLVPPQNVDAAATVMESGLGVFGQYAVDFDTFGAYTNEVDLVNQYRDMSLQPEVDEAINDIVNELIVRDNDDLPVSIDVDALPDEYDENFRHQVVREFDHVMNMLDFKDRCYDILRQFYVDGRLFYDLVIDESSPERGIIEMRNIDPRTIRPIREMRQFDHEDTGARLTQVIDEYYVYSPQGFRNLSNVSNMVGVRIAKDRIAHINSGVYTPGNVAILSYLHKAIKPYNQLRMVEDATVIYRITRAPERRVFYIDVADLPTHRAEQYIQSIATRYRNRVVYDSSTGEVRDDRKVQSMLEDFFLPRRSNGRGTEIQTLPAGQNLGEMADVMYFREKLYRALNIPVSRIEATGGNFTIGRTTEIQRDEIKFGRFLNRIRTRFAMLFDEVLARHLTLKGITRSAQQWRELRQYIRYEFVTDSHFTELKELEVLRERLTAVQQLEPYLGRYFSDQYVRDRILKQTAEEQEEIRQELQNVPEQVPAQSSTLPANRAGGIEITPNAQGQSDMSADAETQDFFFGDEADEGTR